MSKTIKAIQKEISKVNQFSGVKAKDLNELHENANLVVMKELVDVLVVQFRHFIKAFPNNNPMFELFTTYTPEGKPDKVEGFLFGSEISDLKGSSFDELNQKLNPQGDNALMDLLEVFYELSGISNHIQPQYNFHIKIFKDGIYIDFNMFFNEHKNRHTGFVLI